MSAIVIGDYTLAAPTGPSSLLTDLIAFWKLEEASGTRNDSVGAHHLTDVNTVTQATGRIGQAAQFTATNSERLSFTLSGSPLVLSNESFTVSAWMFPDSTQSSNAIDSRPGFSLYLASNTPRFYVEGAGSGDVGWGSALANSAWSHIVGWHEQGVGIGISVNNGTPVTQSYTGGITNSAATFYLGCYTVITAFVDGRMDAVGFWKRVLTSGERAELYNGGAGIEHPF